MRASSASLAIWRAWPRQPPSLPGCGRCAPFAGSSTPSVRSADPSRCSIISAAYTHRVAIANSRLVGLAEGRVSFRWKDYRHHDKQKVMTLAADEFIRRFLLHVLPDGFHRIRHYGYLANGGRAAKLAYCRRLLAAPEPAPPAPAADYRERYQQLTGRALDLCPCCGGRMIEIGVIRRASTFAAAAPWNTS
jgi:Putative transposase